MLYNEIREEEMQYDARGRKIKKHNKEKLN